MSSQGLFIDFCRSLPSQLQSPLNVVWQQYCREAQLAGITLSQDKTFLNGLWRVLALSDYAGQVFCAHPHYPLEFHAVKKNKEISATDLHKIWRFYASEVKDEITLMSQIRQFRHRVLTQILWRELLGQRSFLKHLQELSLLADVSIQIATQYIYESLAKQWGTPCNSQGIAQPFMVIALGKLGGEELNFSSDVDLMFTYPEEGMTDSLRCTNEQFFTKVGQQLIKVLGEVTEEGFVYRVDMRLRPHGQSGNLVMNFAALEGYYQYYGRDWERYALIKARVVTGPLPYAEKLEALLSPFIYRKYLDYGAIEALREMRDLIANEVKRRSLQNDLKLGPGGIRQIEFLVQVFQLIRGGREPQFQHRQLLVALGRLAESGYIENVVFDHLRNAYLFLRICEDRIQMMHDTQTAQLPEGSDRARLFYAMNFAQWEDFYNTLNTHLQRVMQAFKLIFAVPKPIINVNQSQRLLWSQIDDPGAPKILQSLGYFPGEEAQIKLMQFKNSRLCQNLKKHASTRLDKMMPLVISMVAATNPSIVLLSKMLRFVQSLVRKSAYLALLIERPNALAYLIKLCDASEWILEQLCAYPVLLDELLSPPSWKEISEKEFLAKALEVRMRWLANDDLESQMDRLREFKLACYLHFAAHEIFEKEIIDIPLAINELTEVILAKIYELSLQFMISHYQLKENVQKIKEKISFGIVAYGKLGAKELNYASDLDLVFLYAAKDEEVVLQGRVALNAGEFSLRLAQRIIHMLSTHTTSGKLYEVDVRLRPGGSAGLLVSQFPAFRKYLFVHAWTFEHQALVKARVVVGSSIIKKHFEKLRTQILFLRRDPVILKKDIKEMREKMLSQWHSKENILKQGAGGLADIEFIVQYAVLHWANAYPLLSSKRNTIKILQQLSDYQLLSEAEAELLVTAYLDYQQIIRRKILQPEYDFINQPILSHHQQAVIALWDHVFNEKV